MMLIDKLHDQIVSAMKAHDELRVSTLKLLSSAIHNYQIDHKDMTEEEELEVVKKEAKQRRDSIEAYTKANALEKAERESEELKILQEFLPPEMSDEKTEEIVNEVIAEMGLPADAAKLQVGAVIGKVMQKAKGMGDGAKIAQLVKAKLG